MEWTKGTLKVQFSWCRGDKVSELERNKREHTVRQKWRERAREREQEEVGMLGGAVASGGVLTDSDWHVVFSSAAI